MFNILTDQREGPVTFAEPGTSDPFSTSVKAALGNIVPFAPRAVEAVGEAAGMLPTAVTAPLRLAKAAIMAPLDPLLHPEPYRDIFLSADRSMMLANKGSSEGIAIEEVYDRRIAAIKAATGVELESPERYRLSERELRSLNRDGPIDPVQWKRERFEQQLEELRGKHPEQAEALAFGDVGAEAQALAKGAVEAATKAAAADVNPIASFGFSMAGDITGQRRDPLFLGSLFLGPTTAVGKQALTRVATAGLFQGLFNAGMAAIEQPAVQDWRARVGVESGVMPALENVGMAFVMGMIPGAAFRAIHETAPATVLRAQIKRIMGGDAEPGDFDAVAKGLGMTEETPVPAGHVRLYRGESAHNEPSGGYYTTDREMASSFGNVRTVDLPIADAKFFKMPGMGEIYNLTNYEAGPSKVNWRARSKFSSGSLSPEQLAVVRAGEEATQADRAVLSEPRPKDVSPELHDDMMGAALKHADDPINEPSPAAVASVQRLSLERNPIYGADVHAYRIMDGDKNVGELLLRPEGNVLKVLDIAAERGFADGETFDVATARNALGPSGIRSLMRDLRELYPDATRIEGDRISGARFGGKSAEDERLAPVVAFKLQRKVQEPQTPVDQEVSARIAEARPETIREAQLAASEALEDIGTRDTIAQTRAELDRPVFEPPSRQQQIDALVANIGNPQGLRDYATRVGLSDDQVASLIKETYDHAATAQKAIDAFKRVKAAPASSKDPLHKIPMARDDGSAVTVTPATLAKVGEKESTFAMLVRSCK